MLVTTPFAIYGLFRYLYLVHYKSSVGEPDVLFKDKALLIDLAIWIILVLAIIGYQVFA